MGRVKRLWQDKREARWQQHYDDYVLENFGGRDVEGVANDEACDYADEMMEQDELRQ